MGETEQPAVIRLLLDECCSPKLVAFAHARGLDATHVNFLGLRTKPDRVLRPSIAAGDFTFVTNNRKDFLKLYRHVDIHAGLLIIVPSVRRKEQERLLVLALDSIEAQGWDTINKLIEVELDGQVVISAWPFDRENLDIR